MLKKQFSLYVIALISLTNIVIIGTATKVRAQTIIDSARTPSAQSPLQTLSMPVVIRPTLQSGRNETATRRAKNGHFYFDTISNGVPMQMMFDTGASQISLRAEDAARMGIGVGTLTYSRTVNTANGKTEVAPVMIATFTVGNITRRNVEAVVARPGNLSINLLGQSFLSRLAGYKLEGEQLILLGGE